MHYQNFDKLVARVVARDHKTRWGWAECFDGMAAKAGRLPEHVSLATWLDIPDEDAQRFIYMYDEFTPSGAPGASFMNKFSGLPDAAKQNTVLLDFLHTYRTEQRIAWGKAFALVTDGAGVSMASEEPAPAADSHPEAMVVNSDPDDNN